MADPFDTFGPTASAPGGGLVVGSVVYLATLDGAAVPAGIEQIRKLATELSPRIQEKLNFKAALDAAGMQQGLQQAEQQVQQSAARIQRSFDQASQRFRDASSGRFATAPDAVAATLARQEAASAEAFARARVESIGTATSGPLGARAFAAQSLPPLDTAPFKRSTEEAITSLRGVGVAAVDAGGATQRSFAAAGQQISRAGDDIGRSWSGSLRGIAAGFVAFEGAERVVSFVADQAERANQATFTLGKTFGAAAGDARKFAENITGEIGQSIAAIEIADAELARTGRVVGLTRQQILQLGLLAADLSAVSGRSQEQAGHAIAAAFLGQPRGLDILGLPATQQIVKESGELAAAREQDANATVLQTKSQALFNLLMKESAPLQGAARERAQDAAGANDRLSAATANLAASIAAGETPLVRMERGLATVADAAAKAQRQFGVLNPLIAQFIPLGAAAGAAGIAAGGVQPGTRGVGGGRFPGSFGGGGVTPFGGETADQEEALRRRAVAAASTPLFTPPPLSGVEEFSAALHRQEQAAIADKKSIADLTDEQERHAQAGILSRQVAVDLAQVDSDETNRHRQVSAAMRDRAAAMKEAADAAGVLGAAVAGIRAVDAAKDLGGQVPRIFERLTAAEREAGSHGGNLAADLFSKREQAQAKADQQQKQVQQELAREAERDLRTGEDAALAASKKRTDDQLSGIDRAADARRQAHQEDVRQIQEAHQLESERISDQMALLGIRRQQADAAESEKRALDAVSEAQRGVARAGAGPGRPGDAARTTGQQAEAIRNAERGLKDAQASLAQQRTQAAQEALSAGLLGSGAELTPDQIRAGVERLQRGLASQTGLDATTRQRAQQLIGEAGLSPQQQAALPPSERAAIAEAISNALGRGQTEAERKEAKRRDDAEKAFEQDERRLKDWRDGIKEAADAQQEQARQALENAREQRATAAAWKAIGLAPPIGVPATPTQPTAADGGASSSTAGAGVSTALSSIGTQVLFENCTFSPGVGAQEIADSVVAGFNESRGAQGSS